MSPPTSAVPRPRRSRPSRSKRRSRPPSAAASPPIPPSPSSSRSRPPTGSNRSARRAGAWRIGASWRRAPAGREPKIVRTVATTGWRTGSPAATGCSASRNRPRGTCLRPSSPRRTCTCGFRARPTRSSRASCGRPPGGVRPCRPGSRAVWTTSRSPPRCAGRRRGPAWRVSPRRRARRPPRIRPSGRRPTSPPWSATARRMPGARASSTNSQLGAPPAARPHSRGSTDTSPSLPLQD